MTRKTGHNILKAWGITQASFIGLKVFGLINWSWWGVFAPLWIPISTPLLIILAICAGILGDISYECIKLPFQK